MDNKLSELSKPVGHFIEWQDAETGEKEWCECSEQNGNPLYSQEYVSALKHESAVNWEAAASLNVENQELKERIAELESANKSQDDHINQQQDRIDSLEKTNAGLGRRLGDAEKRLATPVRLLGEMLPHEWERADRQATFEHRKIAWDARLAEDKKAILAAGFTFTVEGDE
ncbi:hypothetical protein [Serratia marcescens]|uniref:hypothetical protein n=1 Tax=Serratia marcescens TaxID=615 RepID=UPI0009A4E17D|nr:hypothetical protein [Serratia marcescens]OPJ94775.1 hypothetical protein B1R44_15495 [Serratia marcescens]